MSCMREETFGPTLPVMKVQDVEEAIRLANDSSYGLSASVWTRDRARGEQIARRLEVGAVNVNDMFVERLRVPDPSGRLEGVRRRRAARRRTRDSQVLPPAGDHRDPAGPQVGAALVPLHRPQGQALPARHSLSVSHVTGAAAWGGARAERPRPPTKGPGCRGPSVDCLWFEVSGCGPGAAPSGRGPV